MTIGHNVEQIFHLYDIENRLLQMNIDRVTYCDAAIVFKRFGPVGFDMIAYKWYTADLDPFGSTEKCHVYRIPVQRIDQTSPFEDQIIYTCLAGFQCTGDTDRSAADDDEGIVRTHFG